MTVGEAVSKRIDEYLYIRNMSLYALAKKAEIPVATLQNLYRAHTKSPTLTVIIKICKALDISVGEFMNSPYFDGAVLELD